MRYQLVKKILLGLAVLVLLQSVFTPVQAAVVKAAPSNFSATVLSSGYVRLSWDAVANAEYYVIEATIDGKTMHLFPAPPSTTFLVPFPLASGQTFTFRIQASFDIAYDNYSDYSPVVSITKSARFFTIFGTVPNIPSLLTATTQSDGSVQLNWQDNATNESGFYLYDDDGSYIAVTQLAANAITENQSWLDSTLTSQVKLAAFSTNAVSAWAELTVPHPYCQPPSNLVAVKDSLGRVSLTWQDNSDNELGFEINTSDDDWFLPRVELPAGTTSYLDTRDKIAGYTYLYNVNSVSPYELYNKLSNTVSVYFAEAYTDLPATIPEQPVLPTIPVIPVLPTIPPVLPTIPPVLPIIPEQPVLPTIPPVDPIAESDLKFDGTQSSWAESELLTAYNSDLTYSGVMSDYKQKITREEFCTIVVRLYEKISGLKAAGGTNPFTDASNPEVLKAFHLGIVNGTSASTFSPKANITRQEVSVMILRCLKKALPNLDSTISGSLPFSDAGQINHWAVDAMKFCYAKEIMNGLSSNTIAPLANTTREQGIMLLLRTFENYK